MTPQEIATRRQELNKQLAHANTKRDRAQAHLDAASKAVDEWAKTGLRASERLAELDREEARANSIYISDIVPGARFMSRDGEAVRVVIQIGRSAFQLSGLYLDPFRSAPNRPTRSAEDTRAWLVNNDFRKVAE